MGDLGLTPPGARRGRKSLHGLGSAPVSTPAALPAGWSARRGLTADRRGRGHRPGPWVSGSWLPSVHPHTPPCAPVWKSRGRLTAGRGWPGSRAQDRTRVVWLPGQDPRSRRGGAGSRQRPEEGRTARGGDGLTLAFPCSPSRPTRDAPGGGVAKTPRRCPGMSPRGRPAGPWLWLCGAPGLAAPSHEEGRYVLCSAVSGSPCRQWLLCPVSWPREGGFHPSWGRQP